MKAHVGRGPIGPGILVLVLALFIFGATPGLAGYYRYVDRHGTVRYTDELLEIPEAQRPGARKVTGTLETPKKEVVDSQNEKTAVTEPAAPAPKDTRQAEYDQLTIEKETLDREYKALQQERETLTQDRETLSVKEYNTNVRQLNKHIAAYEKKRNDFQKKADAYNAQVKK